MFDLRFNDLELSTAIVQPQQNRHARLLYGAIGLFNAARRCSFNERIVSTLLGHAWRLLDLNAIPSGQVRGWRYEGIRCVNINQIGGSLGRTSDFDHHFHPLSDRLRDRWVSVAMARCQDIPLPPVNLVQVRNHYFVEDGHHRLSVARTLRESAVDAEITVWDVHGPLPWERCEMHRVLRPVLSAA